MDKKSVLRIKRDLFVVILYFMSINGMIIFDLHTIAEGLILRKRLILLKITKVRGLTLRNLLLIAKNFTVESKGLQTHCLIILHTCLWE